MELHECLKTENSKSVVEQSANFLCSKESCKDASSVEMPCIKCKKHFCVTHRHHGCLELNETEKTQKLKKWQIPKKQFAEAKAIVDQQIADSLKKSKNVALANKVCYFYELKILLYNRSMNANKFFFL